MRPNRVQRSMLSVPGSRPDMFPKAARSGADQVMIDLEDAVAPGDKDTARDTAVTALGMVDWKAAGQSVSVRINDTGTPWMEGDVRAVITGAGNLVDSLVIPKVTDQSDIVRVADLLDEVESAAGITTPVGLEILIETARGMAYVNDIAASHARIEALHFGAGDFGASMGARTLGIGEGLGADSRWNTARVMIAVAARAHELRPIDSAYDDFQDDKGYLAEAGRAAGLGYEGKWAIHPRQVPLANKVFSPTPEEVEAARGLLEALDSAAAEGQGAARYQGKMIDAASARLAENIIRIATRVTYQSDR